MSNLQVNVDIEDPRWEKAVDTLASAAVNVIETSAAVMEDEVDFLALDKNFYINLCLSSDQEVHQLNKRYRQMDKPTNVLSFAALDDEEFDPFDNEPETSLGDVIIAYETMVREADEQGVSLHDHFCHLWTHGILHILGFDHMTPEDAAEMESFETKILAQLGIDDPYRE